MTITAAQLEAEYAEQLGRCENCGQLRDEGAWFEVNGFVICEDCYVDPR